VTEVEAGAVPLKKLLKPWRKYQFILFLMTCAGIWCGRSLPDSSGLGWFVAGASAASFVLSGWTWHVAARNRRLEVEIRESDNMYHDVLSLKNNEKAS
jgi:hypothetical protein